MELVRPKIEAPKKKENIKHLLEKIGFRDEYSLNGTENFWNRKRDDLENLLEAIKKHYRELSKAIHPRTLEDSGEEAANLHSLMTEIEKRFNARLSFRIVREKALNAEDGLIVCHCGCGKKFPYKKVGKSEKIFASPNCKKKFWRDFRKELREMKPKAPIRREDYPTKECECEGCTNTFRLVNPHQKYCSIKCVKKAQYLRNPCRKRTKYVPITAYLENEVEIECHSDGCNNRFKTFINRKGRYDKVYCCKECRVKENTSRFLRKKRGEILEVAPRLKKIKDVEHIFYSEHKEVECQAKGCSNKFTTLIRSDGTSNRKFCSRKCLRRELATSYQGKWPKNSKFSFHNKECILKTVNQKGIYVLQDGNKIGPFNFASLTLWKKPEEKLIPIK